MNQENRPTILLVEDDDYFRAALKDKIEELNYDVVIAPNGKVAKEIIGISNIDLVISDVQMPHFTGVELLEWSYKNKSTPFIIISGFGNIPDCKKAHEMGMEFFLAKPFSSSDLCHAISGSLHQNKSIKNSPKEHWDRFRNVDHTGRDTRIGKKRYCKVSLEDFVSEKSVEMDVYIKLSEKKYIRIAHSGGKIPQEKIEKYKEKGVEQLYIKSEDFKKVLDFNVKLSKLVVGSSAVNREKKKRFMAHTAKVLLENTFVNGVDEESYADAKDFLDHSLDLLTEDEQTFHLLQMISNHNDYLYAHSLGVSIYSVIIARSAGWNTTSNLFKVSFAGLMHDVGKKEIPSEILDKSRALLSQKERMLLESHCLRGKEILESLKSAPTEVVEVAYLHHENCIGQGFPNQLTRQQIHPMARLVSIADEFCMYALKGPNKPIVSAQKALYLMNKFKKDVLDPKFYNYFADTIKPEEENGNEFM